MNIPTYYEGLVNNISTNKNFVTMWLSNDENGDLYDIYYYGEISKHGYIISEDTPELIVAKSIKSNNEIVVYDGAVHGYDNMTWQTHDEAAAAKRTLVKFAAQPAKVKIGVEYSCDYEDEKDDWNVDENNCISTNSGKKITWDELIRNGISWIAIKLVDDNGKENCIADFELA